MNMTKEQVLNALAKYDAPQRFRWLLMLGWNLTIAARSAYPIQQEPGNITHLTGFNEIQHQLFNFIRDGSPPTDWPLESLVETLLQKGQHYGINSGLNWALETSLRDAYGL